MLKITFVEVFNAGVVHGFCNDVLQTVLAARAAGVHLHVAEAQLLQVAMTTANRSKTAVELKHTVQPTPVPLEIHPLTSQTREAVVVFPTPGGPDRRAALYPDPSSLPPYFPVFAVTQQEKK